MLSKFAKIHRSAYTSTNRLTQQTAAGRDSRPSSETQYDDPDTIASTSKKDETKKNETSQNRAGSSKRKRDKKKKSKPSNSETVDIGFDESACGATAWNQVHSNEENGSTIYVPESHKASSRYKETSKEKEKSTAAADDFSRLVKQKKADVAKTSDVTTREVSESTDDHYTGKTTDGNRDKPNSESVSVVEADTFSTLSDPSALK